MSRHIIHWSLALLVMVLLACAFLARAEQATQARDYSALSSHSGTLRSIQISPQRGLNDLPEYMKQEHGKYDNLLTALYESHMQETGGASTSADGSLTEGLGRLSGVAEPFAPLYGPDSRMSNPSFSGNQNEFQVDINPLNTLFAIGASNDGLAAGVGIYRTSDGGSSWTAQDAPIGTVACCSPSVAYGPDGAVYVGVLDTDPSVTYFLRSTDNGATWSVPVTLSTPDRPSLAVDPVSPATIYMTYSDIGVSNRIKGYKSTDRGQTWTGSFFVGDVAPAQGYEQASQPQVASNGWLYVGYQQYLNQSQGCSGGVQNVIARSTNGGASFTYTVLNIIQGGACTPSQLGRGIFCINQDNFSFRSRSHPIIGVHPTNPDIVYMVYSGGELESTYTCGTATGYHSDTLFRKSTDGGITFSTPININLDPAGWDQYFPWLDVAPNGTIWVGWNDRREDPGNFTSRWYQAYSTNEGSTWIESPVADVQTQPSTFIGDYHGLAAKNDRVLGMWYDSRTNASGDPYTDPAAPLVSSTPTRTPIPITPPTVTSTFTPAPTSTSTPTNTPTPTDTPRPPSSTPDPTNPAASSPTATPTMCTMAFTDLSPSDPLYPYIRCLYCRQIVIGYGDPSLCPSGVPCFLPNNNITRGQVSKVVVLAAGLWDLIPSDRQTFSDVPIGSTYWQYIEIAYLHGVLGGYNDPLHCPMGVPCFLPGNPVTRGQLSKIVANAAGFVEPVPSGQQTFADVSESNTFWVFIERLATRNIISGYDCGTEYLNPCTLLVESCDELGRHYFRWCQNITRAQNAKIVAKAFFPACYAPRSK